MNVGAPHVMKTRLGNAEWEIAQLELDGFSLTPLAATVIFVLSVLCGYRYRRVWKAEGPRWQLWLFGACAAAGLLVLGLVPLKA